MSQIIGFATEFYTLWNYTTEALFTTDTYGNHHSAGIKHNYYYIQNISKDIDVVKSKYPSLSIDEGLRGKHRSFDRVERVELPAEYFPWGKHQGKLISDVANTDMKYLLWFIENGPARTTDLIKELPQYKLFLEEQEKSEKERKGEPAFLSTGKNVVTISTNGRSDFHVPEPECEQYFGRPYMMATLYNEKEFPTNVLIILKDVKEVDGRYPYLMPIINGKAMKTKNKELALDLEIIHSHTGYSDNFQIAVLK